jgi:hypothetical protein
MFFFACRSTGPRPWQVTNAVAPAITTVAKSAWILIFSIPPQYGLMSLQNTPLGGQQVIGNAAPDDQQAVVMI